MSLWDFEKRVSRRARRTSGQGWTRKIVFDGVPTDIADSSIPSEWSYYPGESGKHAACLYHSDIDEMRYGSPGNSQVTLLYRPRTFEEWLEQHPNKGILLGQSAAHAHKVFVVDGNIIEGKDPRGLVHRQELDDDDEPVYEPDGTTPKMITTEGVTEWMISSGTNQRFGPRAVYEIYAVISNRDAYFFQFVGQVGKWNTTIMSNFPLAPLTSRTGQWLLAELSCAPRVAAARLFTLKASFMLNIDTAEGWSANTVSEEFETFVKTTPIMNRAGIKVGERRVAALVVTGRKRTNQLIKGANFSPLNSLLLNSWE